MWTRGWCDSLASLTPASRPLTILCNRHDMIRTISESSKNAYIADLVSPSPRDGPSPAPGVETRTA